jgi:hypothetical protein
MTKEFLGFKTKEILICILLVVMGYFVAKMFGCDCLKNNNGFSVGGKYVVKCNPQNDNIQLCKKKCGTNKPLDSKLCPHYRDEVRKLWKDTYPRNQVHADWNQAVYSNDEGEMIAACCQGDKPKPPAPKKPTPAPPTKPPVTPSANMGCCTPTGGQIGKCVGDAASCTNGSFDGALCDTKNVDDKCGAVCKPPDPPEGGSRTMNVIEGVTEAHFACKDDRVMSGSAVSTCGISSNGIYTAPTCDYDYDFDDLDDY